MQRARQSHQKLERREAILAMARGTLEDTPFQDITMTQIATRAGLVKGTLYLYFSTKEELFLEVLRNEFHGWFWDLEASLESLPRRKRLEAAANLIAETTAARSSFRVLLAVLHGTLEHNLSVETALAFRLELQSRTGAMGDRLERTLPFLKSGEGVALLLQVVALAIGLQAMTTPAAQVQRLLEGPELGASRLDFAPAFRCGVRALLIGFKGENSDGQA